MTDDICGKCGYDLSASSVMGTCPECATFYSKQSGENIRGSQVNRAENWLGRAWGIALIVAALITLSCGGILATTLGRAKPLAIMAVVAFVLILAAAATLVRDRPQP